MPVHPHSKLLVYVPMIFGLTAISILVVLMSHK
jgi:hypothetical protein